MYLSFCVLLDNKESKNIGDDDDQQDVDVIEKRSTKSQQLKILFK